MRAILAAVALVTACMHDIPVAPVEQCAAQGMVLEGITMSNGTTRAVATDFQGHYAYGAATSDDVSVSCRPPRTTLEHCKMVAAQRSFAIRVNYNPSGYNLLLFVGYAAFFLPGLILYAAFTDPARDDVIGDANKTLVTLDRWCEQHNPPL